MRIIYCSVVDGKLEFDLGHIRKIILPETPSVPVGLEAVETTGGYVELQWANVGDAARWDVYRDGVYLATSISSGYKDSTVQPSTSYSYQVLASNLFSSALSSALSVTTAANSVPNWSITGQVAFLSVPYTLDLDTVCQDIDEHSKTYTIVSGSIAGFGIDGNILENLLPLAVASTNMTLRANDGFGTSDITIAFAVRDPDVTAPSVPSVTASVTGSTVTLTWTASTDTNGVDHYKVYRDGVLIDTATSLQYTDSELANGTYTYSVSAVDGSSNANESAQGSASPVVVSVVDPTPDTPVNVQAVQNPPSSIDVSWEEGPSGSDPDDYDVEYGTSVSGPWTTWPHTGTATTTTITGLSAGTYFVRVRANNGGNSSSFSAPVQVNLTPTGTAADFTLAATTGTVTFNGNTNNVQPGDIIELAAGTHGPIVFSNVFGTAANRVLIRGPATGLATIRRSDPSSGGFVFHFRNCRHVDIDGFSTTQTAAGLRAKSRNIKVMYATNATALNKDAPSSFFKLSGSTSNTTTSFTSCRNIGIRYVEVDGGWPTRGSHGIGIATNDSTFKAADFPGTYQEDITIDHCYIHNCHGEGVYSGPNTYHTVRPAGNPEGQSVPLRYMKVRYNDVVDVGGDGFNCKSWFGGSNGGDGATENSIHHNVIIRAGTNTAADANGRLGMSLLSTRTDVYNNWVESSGGHGIALIVSEGTEVGNAGLTFTARVYNNVCIDNGTIDAAQRDGILINSHGTIPSTTQMRGFVFNNTTIDNAENGIRLGPNAHSSSWARNNVSLSNGATNIVSGPGSKSSNLESGAASAFLQDVVGTYEAGNLDLELIGASLASGTIGSGVPGTWLSTVDIAPTDYDDITRSSPDKGAYEL